ncbi:hypothetical protein [Halobacterium salinarum]|uniref:hypothetical protein n=1 Tax=Halobacterium salinarum TaxID=2242 RepID=UPI001F411A56|nr:hypothetical protein [Halobacterium salinarum]MDL0143427.1 hypothetical protein [Halobacterium salinarum]
MPAASCLEMVVPLSDGHTGLALNDNIYNRRVVMRTPTRVTPTPTDPSTFLFPVEEAARVHTDRLTTAKPSMVFLRDDATGDPLDALTEPQSVTVSHDDPRLLEFQTPVRTYVRVPGGTTTTVTMTLDDVTVSFPDAHDLQIGVRSQHSHPIGEITTTTDPVDVMAAVEQFGAALQTPSPERSWPTLRGHPPRLTVGQPDSTTHSLSRPDVDVTVGVPPELGAVYAVTPLAFYLGARVEPSSTPSVTAGGHQIATFPRDTLGRAAGALLKHVFTLDCVVRSVGLYDLDTPARDTLTAAFDWTRDDLQRLYDMPLAARLQAYTEYPQETVLAAAPRWRHTVMVADDPRPIEHLSFLANDLAVVRTLPDATPDSAPALSAAVDEFMRSTTDTASDTRGHGVIPDEFVAVPETDTMETSYIGPGVPVGDTKLIADAYDARFSHSSTDSVSVNVVCNEDDMWDEYSEFSLYGNRDGLEFDVSVTRNATRAELADVLTSMGDTDFFHYIGHVRDGTQFVCTDGALSFDQIAATTTPPRVFLLNGCSSYELGRAFIDAGSQAGIITVRPIGNDAAMLIGQNIARFVNQGFSPRSALAIVQRYGRADDKYMVLGDGGHEVAQSKSGIPVMPHLTTLSSEHSQTYRLSVEMLPAENDSLGGIYSPNFEQIQQQIYGGFTHSVTSTAQEVQSFLDLDSQMPVVLDGSLHWAPPLEVSPCSTDP